MMEGNDLPVNDRYLSIAIDGSSKSLSLRHVTPDFLRVIVAHRGQKLYHTYQELSYESP